MIYSSARDFLDSSTKSITLMGMSGVGKSYLSSMMRGWGWFQYSCDVAIGTQYLAAHIDEPVHADDISAVSRFIAKPGDLPLAEFQRRQKLYYDAECAALARVPALAAQHPKFVHDSTGSVCEIEDEALIGQVGQASLFVYIKASTQEENAVLERARLYPKPLFYPPAQFKAWVHEYCQVFGVEDVDSLPADDFTRWVFPRLFETRLPKYQDLAHRYGVTVQSADMHMVRSEDDFLALIAAGFERMAG